MTDNPKSDRWRNTRETDTVRALGGSRANTGDLVEPIHASAVYRRDPSGAYPGGHSYSRDQNPSFDAVEASIARLEGGEEAMLFASGMAAAATIFDALPLGARVLAPEQMYWTIHGWLGALADRDRLEVVWVAMDDLEAVASLLSSASFALVWIETPSNPLCTIYDIATIAELAHANGSLVVCDGTLATPVLTRPLEMGADLVMHSATKQLNGHSDVLAGVLVTRAADDFWAKLRQERSWRGAVLGPFEAWLLGRGLRTLFLRVRRSAGTALFLAEGLAANAAVSQVLYPGLVGHPGHELAAKQMDGGFGPLLSLRLRGGAAAVRRFLSRVEIFQDATSLGGVESLVEHRALVEGVASELPEDLVRLSIGLEDPGDLLADLEQALASPSDESS